MVRKITACFVFGQMFVKRGNYFYYPRVKQILSTGKDILVIFTIPFGLDPEIVEKKKYLFEQVIPGCKLERDGQMFIIRLQEKIKGFDYCFDDIKEQFETMRLPIVVGKDHDGMVCYDMTKYPHLLIAGETGSGKSTQLRSVLTALIQSGKNIRLYLADLKRSEFHLFKSVNKVDFLAYDADITYKMVKKARKIMMDRYEQMEKEEVTNCYDLQNPPPYIVICIDEVAIIRKEKEIMETIDEISAVGRAAGVYLILSMQRPDKDVIDGRLKNNLTVRMAFRHSDEINSRITLNSGEAAYIPLTERGSMIYRLEKSQRIQGPYLSPDKAKEILKEHKERFELQWLNETN